MLDVPFTANARALGSRQADAMQRITASFDLRRMANGDSLVGNAGTFGAMAFAATGGGVSTTMDLATSAATLAKSQRRVLRWNMQSQWPSMTPLMTKVRAVMPPLV